MYSDVTLLTSGSLSNAKVVNGRDEHLGYLEEIMLDVVTGRVAYAVISFQGILGLDDKLFAVPWQALTIDENEKLIFMSVDKETIENAPGFHKNKWPRVVSHRWLDEIYQYYDQSDYRERLP